MSHNFITRYCSVCGVPTSFGPPEDGPLNEYCVTHTLGIQAMQQQADYIERRVREIMTLRFPPETNTATEYYRGFKAGVFEGLLQESFKRVS